MNKKITTIGAAFALVPMLTMANQPVNQAHENKNVLLILCDDMGAMELGCYGSNINTTPNLDMLAQNGVRFETFFATPVCSPTRVSLMTGKYPYKTGWANMNGRHAGGPQKNADLAKDEYTFGQMFQDGGYSTALAGKLQGNPAIRGEEIAAANMLFLVNLKDDPGEMANLAEKYPEK